MEALERDVSGAKAAVEAADVNNPAALMTTLTQVESTLAGMNPPNPLGELTTAPRLQRAAERAARCQQLSALGSSAPR
jgi:histidinol-phosphate/aromatic aminotransferase/cobyric acid decarboxylase-like protein